MTREEAILNHRKMWNWLADNPGRWKEDYLRKYDPEAELYSNCYLCEYVREHHNCYCEGCPVEWPDGCCTDDSGRLYNKWFSFTIDDDYTKAAEIARQIAELPEREVEA